jgi:sugar phosphate permease
MPHIMLNLQNMPNIPFLNYFTFGMTGNVESSELGWFGIIKGGGYLAALFGTFLVGKVVETERLLSVSRALTFSTFILGLSALVFGAANGFLLALFSYWLLIAVEESMYPLRVAFVNRGVQSSERATLISIISQSTSFGEMSAGPLMAIISVAKSVSFALITSAVASVSASLLFAKSSFPLKENEG